MIRVMRYTGVLAGITIYLLSSFGNIVVLAETRILALGDSLTEGFGVESTEAYPHLLETKLKEKGYTNLKIINAGISGSTSASAVSRVKWYLRLKPEIIILALGANDGLRGLSIVNMKRHLGAAIELARKRDIKVLLAGMQMPLNYGARYTMDFKNAFYELAEKNRVPLIPFLLEGVGGVPELNLPDGIHPNPAGHRIIMNNVLKYLEPLL